MIKRLESPRICAQLLHASSRRIESVCWSFEVEIKTADFYSFHKQRYSILHLFTCRVLVFSCLPVGTYIKERARNLHEGDAKTRIFNNSPAVSWGWYMTAYPFLPKILVWQISILPTRALPPALIKQSNTIKKTWIALMWFYCAFSSFYLAHTQWPFSSKMILKNVVF